MTELRRNRVKRKLADGGIATIISGPVTGDIIEFLGQLPFDGIWIEAEHGPIDYGDVPDLTRACDLWGKTSVVRVALNLPGVIYRTLDLGAQGIVVPHVNTAEEARAVVDAAKFHPLGARGMYTSRQGIGVADYFAKANAETLVVVLIEDIVAVNNLTDILKVDNIDVFFVATGDLSQSMGHLGQPNHPEVVAVATRAHRQIIDAGRVSGAVVSESNVQGFISEGVRFLMTSWQPWLVDGSKAFLARVAASR
jgi:4-hydroxy-2-oxoheptanedioate aldolase